jgi:hypothetical protein
LLMKSKTLSSFSPTQHLQIVDVGIGCSLKMALFFF